MSSTGKNYAGYKMDYFKDREVYKAVPAYPSKFIGQDCPFWESLREGDGNDG